MDLARAVVAAYSPCGSTMAVARAVARGTGLPVTELDLARSDPEGRHFAPDELVVLAAPTYGGRLSARAEERMAPLAGAFSPAVAVAAYGDRDPGTCAYEIQELARAAGMAPVAAIEAPCTHVMVAALGAGRPSVADLAVLEGFGAEVAASLGGDGGPFGRHLPLEPRTGADPDCLELGFHGVCDPSACVGCGACAHACPGGCIPVDEPYLTDTSRCDGCCACIAVCPVGARHLDDGLRLAAVEETYTALWNGPHRPRLWLGDVVA